MKRKKVTKITSDHQSLLNDDDTKPFAYKITKEDQGKRFFISWHLRLYGDREVLDGSIDIILSKSQIRLQQKKIPTYRKLCETILLNLSKSLLTRSWVQILKASKDYTKGTVPHSLNFSLRHVNDILSTLLELEWINEKKGIKSEKNPQISAYMPTEYFDINLAISSLSAVNQPADKYVVITKPEKESLDPREQRIVDEDERDLAVINGFLLDKTFPFHSSMVRKYSKKVGLAGRIYCDFQRISKRRVQIRQFSLINGNSIAEVDIVSSHPRMAIQKFHNIKISRSFYQDIADELGLAKSIIKKFFAVSLSSVSREKARQGFTTEKGYTLNIFETIEALVVSRYPKVPFYTGWSLVAMNHEGEILKSVMLKGVSKGITVLPIHDAVAVEVDNATWAEHALRDSWREYFDKDYCEVDITRYDTPQYS